MMEVIGLTGSRVADAPPNRGMAARPVLSPPSPDARTRLSRQVAVARTLPVFLPFSPSAPLDPDQCRDWLLRCGPVVSSVLARLCGKCELRLQVVLPGEKATPAVSLRDRARRVHRLTLLRRAAEASLCSLAACGKVVPLHWTGARDGGTAAVLLPRDRVPRSADALPTRAILAAAEGARVAVTLTGPWPPLSFSNIEEPLHERFHGRYGRRDRKGNG